MGGWVDVDRGGHWLEEDISWTNMDLSIQAFVTEMGNFFVMKVQNVRAHDF